MFDIQEELKKLPARPGVYLMHDAQDTIIYVGKALSLKNRVRQYFQGHEKDRSPKIAMMISLISWFEYIVTDSEMEALVLECNLIKEHRPKYNTTLMDDKAYPFIRVTVNEPYPKITLAREMKKDKSRYFGPYTSIGAVRDTLNLLHKLYKIRTCNRSLPANIGKERPCLNYHIKQCDAPCQGYISEEAYRESVEKAIDFLNGNYGPIRKKLEEKMKEAAENLDFETAVIYRELLGSVSQIAQKQKMTDSGQEDRDVIAMALDGEDAVVQVFFVREGKLIGRDHFALAVGEDETRGHILGAFVKQFYAGTPFLPKELFLQCPIEDEELIAAWLEKKRGQKVLIRTPVRGEKARLVELAEKNAALILSQDKEKLKRENLRTVGAVHQLEELLGLTGLVRMEAFDISNISGFQSVGSMVVYENGRPKRNDYRKFKIKSVKGANDYASMKEVLTRRFMRGLEELREEENSFTRLPDILLMDGGKGQVNIALEVLEELKLNIPVCGMVKDDNHRTRGLYYRNEELPIDRHSELFKLITRIQDEAHRFAIEYHRSLRSKGQVHSILDDIEGIGPARRKALMRHFKGVEELKAATVEELKGIPQMNEKAAKSVYSFFHP